MKSYKTSNTALGKEKLKIQKCWDEKEDVLKEEEIC